MCFVRVDQHVHVAAHEDLRVYRDVDVYACMYIHIHVHVPVYVLRVCVHRCVYALERRCTYKTQKIDVHTFAYKYANLQMNTCHNL